MNDATVKTLERLNDERAWDHIERDVVVLKPHIRTMKRADGKKVKVEVDEERLKRIARILRKLQDEEGTLAAITEGHRQVGRGPDGKRIPQKDQAPLLGVGANARFGYWGPKKQAGVLIDEFILPGCLEKAKQLPFRSAEIYLSELEPGLDFEDHLTGIALLRTDPELTMGTVLYDHEGRGFFAYGIKDDTMATPETDPTVNSQPQDDQMGEYEHRFHQCMQKHYGRYHDDHFQKHYAHLVAPSPTNQTLPKHEGPPPSPPHAPASPPPPPHSVQGHEPPVREEPEEKRHHLEHGSDAALYERRVTELENTVKLLSGSLASRDKESRLLRFRSTLNQLQYEHGFQLNIEEELKDCEDFTQAQFDKHCERIKKNYAKEPVDPIAAQYVRNNGVHLYNGPSEGPRRREVTATMIDAAVKHAEVNKMDFDQAFEKLNGFKIPVTAG